MIRITNGSITLKVTDGAFETYYANRGFHAVGAEEAHEGAGVLTTHPTSEIPHLHDNSQQESDSEDEDDELTEDEDEDDIDLSEIPLSEMSFDQLNDYADELEINHSGIRSKKELRAVIRKHLG